MNRTILIDRYKQDLNELVADMTDGLYAAPMGELGKLINGLEWVDPVQVGQVILRIFEERAKEEAA